MSVLSFVSNLAPVRTYPLEEGLKIFGMSTRERLKYSLFKKVKSLGINVSENDSVIFRTTAVALGLILYAETVFAKANTGIKKLDEGGWKLVGVAQSVIFWATMLYTFRSLLAWVMSGDEREKKKVGQGFIICVCNYLIPWGFEIIKDIFV